MSACEGRAIRRPPYAGVAAAMGVLSTLPVTLFATPTVLNDRCALAQRVRASSIASAISAIDLRQAARVCWHRRINSRVLSASGWGWLIFL